MTHPGASELAWRVLGAAPQGFSLVNLSTHVNNTGIAGPDAASGGGLDGEGMAFPSEVMPPRGALVAVGGVPFLWPESAARVADNVILEGQRIQVPPGRYRALHVLGVSEGGSFEETLILHHGPGGLEEVDLGLTDCRPHWGRLKFGEQVAVRFKEMRFPPGDTHTSNGGEFCGLWKQTLAVDDAGELVAVQLPDNPCMHVFAMTLEQS